MLQVSSLKITILLFIIISPVMLKYTYIGGFQTNYLFRTKRKKKFNTNRSCVETVYICTSTRCYLEIIHICTAFVFDYYNGPPCRQNSSVHLGNCLYNICSFKMINNCSFLFNYCYRYVRINVFYAFEYQALTVKRLENV